MLSRVALVVNLGTFRDETLTPFLTTVFDDSTTGLSLHTRTESVLTLANPLGWLKCALTHGR